MASPPFGYNYRIMKQDDPKDAMERPVQRSRKLVDEKEIWSHNSWDDAEWTEVQESEAAAIISRQLQLSPHLEEASAVTQVVETPAASCWDRFYAQHNRWFFKDRRWLTSEFPELFDANLGERILEVGCGAGNTIFPLARFRPDPTLRIFACDFAPSAVQLVREFREFDSQRMTVFLHDLAKDDSFKGIPDGSMDIVVAIFVLSALDPARLPSVFTKLYRVLRPGGLLLFRDYGQYDMTQLRFKPNRLIRPNLYVRGDGTGVHFFCNDEISDLATFAGFTVVSNTIDRRVLVNRFRKLTMYRVWIQAKLMKRMEGKLCSIRK